MNDKTLGAYKRTTPDPDETTGEALARLQAEMTRLLDEADAELRDEADGGVAAALIEQEAQGTVGALIAELEHHRARAEKVEQERDHWKREADNANEDLAHLRAAVSRPLTPEAITDEMVERARKRGSELVGALWDPEVVEAMLTAALTPEPERPDGAEELGELIGTWTASEDIAPAQLPTGSLATLADFLAEHGVRVVGEEDPR